MLPEGQGEQVMRARIRPLESIELTGAGGSSPHECASDGGDLASTGSRDKGGNAGRRIPGELRLANIAKRQVQTMTTSGWLPK